MAPFLYRFSVLICLLATGSNCQSLNQLFTVDPSCDSLVNDAVLDEVRDLLAAAQIGIRNVNTTTTFFTKKTKNFQRNLSNTFGTNYYTSRNRSGITAGDRLTLNDASANYQQLQTLLSGQTLVVGPNSKTLTAAGAYISCETAQAPDGGYVSTSNAGDIEPAKQGQSVYEAYQVNHLYYIPNQKDARGVETVVMRPNAYNGNNRASICGTDGVVAETQMPVIDVGVQPKWQILLCAELFDTTKWKRSISSAPPKTAQKTDFKYLAGALLHEMFHLISNTYGDRSWIFQNQADPNDPRNGKPVAMYGPLHAYGVHRYPKNYIGSQSKDTYDQPDPLRIFAEECQFPGTQWSVDQRGL